ncbi:hypothetical protein [Rhizobium sp.]
MAARRPLDPLTQATVTVTWVIVLNKPFYPLYVWWLVGSGVQASLGTLLSVPFFLFVLYLARNWPLAARLGLPIVGTLDTVFETKLFGYSSGTELFLAPCMMLAALSFNPLEKWWQRGLAAGIFLVFVVTHGRLGAALYAWTVEDLATLFSINAFAVASLMAFIAIRYAGVRRKG